VILRTGDTDVLEATKGAVLRKLALHAVASRLKDHRVIALWDEGELDKLRMVLDVLVPPVAPSQREELRPSDGG